MCGLLHQSPKVSGPSVSSDPVVIIGEAIVYFYFLFLCIRDNR